MEKTTVDLTIDEEILSELEIINGKIDTMLSVLEEMKEDNAAYYEMVSADEITAQTTSDTFQDFIVSSTTASLTLSVCSLGVQLILLGSFLARILFRRM